MLHQTKKDRDKFKSVLKAQLIGLFLGFLSFSLRCIMIKNEIVESEEEMERQLDFPKITFLSKMFFYCFWILLFLSFVSYLFFLYGVFVESKMLVLFEYLVYLNYLIGLMLGFFGISKILKKTVMILRIKKLMNMEVGQIDGSKYIADLRLFHSKIYILGYGCLVLFSIVLSYILINYGNESTSILKSIFDYPSFLIAISSLVVCVFSLVSYYYLNNRLDDALFWAQIRAYEKQYKKEKAENLST